MIMIQVQLFYIQSLGRYPLDVHVSKDPCAFSGNHFIIYLSFILISQYKCSRFWFVKTFCIMLLHVNTRESKHDSIMYKYRSKHRKKMQITCLIWLISDLASMVKTRSSHNLGISFPYDSYCKLLKYSIGKKFMISELIHLDMIMQIIKTNVSNPVVIKISYVMSVTVGAMSLLNELQFQEFSYCTPSVTWFQTLQTCSHSPNS